MKKTMAGLALAFVTMALGCGGSQHTSTAASVPTCEDAAANNEKVILAMGQAQGQDMTAYATAGRETYAERCAADRWSPDVVACAAHAADSDAIIACVEQLTPEQHQAMEDTFGAKMGAGGGTTDDAAPHDPCGGGD